jgi:hypothetical protein
MGASFTVSIYGSMRKHAPMLESLKRLVETGDGPVIHAVDAALERDEFEYLAGGAEVVAIVLRPSWSEGYINTKAVLLARRYGADGRLVALVGVPRKRLSPEAQALAKWVIY